MSDVFSRFAPFIQDYIYRCKWEELREIQVLAAKAIFDTDENLLLSSGTASGKTEAAFLPVLTQLWENPSASVGVLYLSPLKALINDQFERLEGLLEEAAIPVTKWHGDASAAAKKRVMKRPQGVIQTTPESLESMLMHNSSGAYRLFSDAEANRDSVYIKAKAEGFEQGTRDGREACLAAGRDILDEAKSYAERINSEKEQLFADYEKEIYDTVMQIAKKVTLDSITSKDSAAVKRLIKKAAKEFRNCERVKITLNDNGANEELTGDYEYLKELCGGIPNVEVELLPEADPGTVIVDNGSEIVDAGIMTQLRMIQELGDGKFREPKPTRKKKKPAPEPAEEADAEE